MVSIAAQLRPLCDAPVTPRLPGTMPRGDLEEESNGSMSAEQAARLEQIVNESMIGSDICAALIEGTLTACEPIPRGSNYSFFVTLENDHQQLRGVYKPRQGERPLW